MKKSNSFRRFQIGPGAASLILILVVLSMSALGILALVNSRGDYKLSVRSTQVAEQIYQLNELAEDHLAGLDAILLQAAGDTSDDTAYLAAVKAALPSEMTLEDRTVSWTESLDTGRMLSCAVYLNEAGISPRFRWTDHSLYYESTEMDTEEWN